MRSRLFLIIGVAALLAVGDWMVPASDRPSTKLALAGIHLYQATLSPVYSRMGVRCRFTPTCSHYAEAAIDAWGVWRGGWLAARRVIRCGPWTPAGTVDPPPLPAGTAAARPR